MATDDTISIEELAATSGLTVAELTELVEYGALTPQREAVFSITCVSCVRRAARLRNDFELEIPAIALLITFLERIETLESELRQLSARLPR
jgi:chaperone modulatory protein CbpM